MYKNIICLLVTLLLASCSFIHRSDIEEGNVITPQMTQQLHTGMSEAQVREVMGNPVLINIFTLNHINYVYTMLTGRGQYTERRIICVFRAGRLQEIIG